MALKSGAKVQVYDYNEGYWKVKYKKRIFYCITCEFQGKEVAEIKESKQRREREIQEEAEKQRLAEAKERYLKKKKIREAERREREKIQLRKDSIEHVRKLKRDTEYLENQKQQIKIQEERNRVKKNSLIFKIWNNYRN